MTHPTHTPEPWRQGDSDYGVIYDAEGRDVAYAHTGISSERERAAAARIVACVNGCEGLDPAAYRECVDVLDTIANKPIGHAEASHREVLDAVVDIARAALAKARRTA